MDAGRELNALVAVEVMGWAKRTTEFNDEQVAVVPPDWTDLSAKRWLGHSLFELVPPYSEDIAAGFVVVEHMRAQGWIWHIAIGATVTVSIERAGIRHYNLEGVLVGPGSRRIDVHPVAPDELPLALCRAALAAVGVESH
jgi:hypothetical protein